MKPRASARSSRLVAPEPVVEPTSFNPKGLSAMAASCAAAMYSHPALAYNINELGLGFPDNQRLELGRKDFALHGTFAGCCMVLNAVIMGFALLKVTQPEKDLL